MIRNFFKTAWRNLVKNKAHSSINIIGLSVGLSSFIVILLYLNYELSYDKWSPALQHAYRVSVQTDDEVLQSSPAPLGALLRENSSFVDAATTIAPDGDYEFLVSTGDNKIYQDGAVDVDSSFFKVFPYHFLEGNSKTALNKPNALVLTKDVATKLFGSAEPMGKMVKLLNTFDCEVTGVIEKPRQPSHLKAEFMYRSPYRKDNMFWENYSFQTYITVKGKVATGELEYNFNSIFYNNRLKKDKQSLAAFQSAGHKAGLFIDRVPDIHNFPRHGNSNFGTVSILLVLAILLLLAGAINFSNLSIAASVKRAKEVGVRKVMGSSRQQLLWQFMGEIALQCIASLCVATILVDLILPLFNRLFDIRLRFFESGSVVTICLQIAICLVIVMILSGLYPAVFLSRYNINKVLKGDYSTGAKGIKFRNALIVIQFTVSAFFIIATMVIRNQMHFMQTRDKGFSGEQVMRIQSQQVTRDKNFDITRADLLSIPGVVSVAKTTNVPGDEYLDTSLMNFKNEGREYRIGSVKVSTDYFKTLGIGLVKGRLFDNRADDQNTRSIIINESAARTLHLNDPVNAILTFPYCDTVPTRIIGIVKDFHVSGFENVIRPEAYTIGNNACMFQSGGAMLVKLQGKHLQSTIATLESAWKKIEPDFPIRYSFLDENFQKLFASYQRLEQVINFFGITAILISLMGLFALTVFLVSQRTKEIGIRKILGAGIGDISIMLSKHFLKLILASAVIAIPIGWWATNKWLESFAYRVSIGWVTFAIATLIILAVSLITVSFQAIKAAVANPTNSLRTE